MGPGDSLHLIVEASLALAGFAGVVTALTKRGASGLPPLHRLNLVNLLATSLGALFLSLAALTLLAAGVEEPLTWRVVSSGGLLVTVYFGSRSIQTVVSSSGDDPGNRGIRALLAINLPLLLVCLALVWNLIHLAEFWPFFLLLVALFAIGCFSFVRLLSAPAD